MGSLHVRLMAALAGLLAAAAGLGAGTVRELRRGRAGRPEALRRVPWLLLIVFILLVFGALVWAADVVLTAEGRPGV